ncbi:unnamed protein product [Trichobilharzia regenti]|nr:unnamed protein product [Trichobilharzia regenti]
MLAACVDGFDESGTGITSLDYFVYIWNLFNMMPIDSNDPLRIESVEVEKKHLFQCFSRLKCFHVWLTKNPPNIRGSDVKSLVLFFEEFLKYTFLTKTSLEPHYMESVSCLILLSWWNIGFRSFLRGLTDIYRESVEELSERNKAERGEDRTYLDDLNDGDDGDDGDCSSTAIDSMKTVCSAIVEILKNLVR